MNRLLFTFAVLLCCTVVMAQEMSSEQYESLCQRTEQIERTVDSVTDSLVVMSQYVSVLTTENAMLRSTVDSLRGECDLLRVQQHSDRDTLTAQISASSAATTIALDRRTLWGIVAGTIAIIVIAIVAYCLYRRQRSDSSTLATLRTAQAALSAAQTRLQEDAMSLDNKMLELIDKQLATSVKSTPVATVSAVDHSLALKVADEIVRIEMNLSRMDSSIKGYKQLSKAVERIKNNFLANGYEVVDMLGKPYNEGMRVIANFVPDDSLAAGEQKITGITKPQVNYQGKMIQAAQITVSQNI